MHLSMHFVADLFYIRQESSGATSYKVSADLKYIALLTQYKKVSIACLSHLVRTLSYSKTLVLSVNVLPSHSKCYEVIKEFTKIADGYGFLQIE